MTFYSLNINTFWIIWPIFLQGIGLGLIFVPLSTVAYATLARSRMAEAAGIYSLLRTIGSAVGISIVTTVMTRQAQVIWNDLGVNFTIYNPALTEYLQRLQLSMTDPRALGILGQLLAQQAQMGAILDAYKLITWSFLVMLPLLLLLKKSSAAPVSSAAAME
jgi:DHA2 family multidrug resistance protein